LAATSRVHRAIATSPVTSDGFFEYRSSAGPETVHISQSSASDAGLVFGELVGAANWDETIADNGVIYVTQAGHQAQAYLEQAGTFVFLMSETLTTQQLKSIAVGLAPMPPLTEA